MENKNLSYEDCKDLITAMEMYMKERNEVSDKLMELQSDYIDCVYTIETLLRLLKYNGMNDKLKIESAITELQLAKHQGLHYNKNLWIEGVYRVNKIGDYVNE